MKVYLGSDHAGFDRKEELLLFIKEQFSFELNDLGTKSNERANYPDYATAVAKAIQSNGGSKGILVCGSGIGVSIVANRYKGIRAARCLTEEDAKMSRLHNDANVLCLASRMTDFETTKKIISIWFNTEFEGGRHAERIDLFNDLGQ